MIVKDFDDIVTVDIDDIKILSKGMDITNFKESITDDKVEIKKMLNEIRSAKYMRVLRHDEWIGDKNMISFQKSDRSEVFRIWYNRDSTITINKKDYVMIKKND